jgi:cytochrome o ubiquinol oxidase subunit III
MSDQVSKHPGLNLGPAHRQADDEAEEMLFGFWVFLMSDAIVFGVLFATYAIMLPSTAGGPGPHQVFDLKSSFIETCALLSSSFTYGMASVTLKYGRRVWPLMVWLFVTMILGGAFLRFEVMDFLSAYQKGSGPDRSGFASAYFGIVPLHGMHVTVGILWMLSLIVQVWIYGIDKDAKLGFLRLGLFWHFLDIVWIVIFSVVYLMGLA